MAGPRSLVQSSNSPSRTGSRHPHWPSGARPRTRSALFSTPDRRVLIEAATDACGQPVSRRSPREPRGVALPAAPPSSALTPAGHTVRHRAPRCAVAVSPADREMSGLHRGTDSWRPASAALLIPRGLIFAVTYKSGSDLSGVKAPVTKVTP